MNKILAICLMLCASWIFADEIKLTEVKKPAKKEGFGGFTVGVIYQDMSPLNQRLTKLGYNEIKSTFATIGGGGYGCIGNNFLIGGSGLGGIPNITENDSVRIEVSSGYGFFEIGYIAYEDLHFRIWPMIGIGGGGTTINIEPNNEQKSFDEILQKPKRTTDLNYGGLAIKLAINNDAVFYINPDSEDRMTLTASLQLGMIYGMGDSGWEAGIGSNASKGPVLANERFFMSMSIFFGGSVPEKIRNKE